MTPAAARLWATQASPAIWRWALAAACLGSVSMCVIMHQTLAATRLWGLAGFYVLMDARKCSCELLDERSRASLRAAPASKVSTQVIWVRQPALGLPLHRTPVQL